MRRLPILAVLVLAIAFPASGLAGATNSPTHYSSSRTQLLAFGGHFGSGHFGLGGRSFGRGSGYFGRGRSHHFLRHAVHALAFAYLLHLFFSHGGLSIIIWLIVIGLVVHLVRRRRRHRRRYYAT